MAEDPAIDGGCAPDEGDEFERRAAERVVGLGSGVDVASFAASFDLFRLATRLTSDFDTAVHRPRGLSMAGFRVLFTMWVFGSLEIRAIARLSGVTRAAVSGVVTTLERDGLAVRRRDQADGRLATVALTDAGDNTVRAAYSAQHARERMIFADIDPAELAAFTTTLRRLLAVRLPDNQSGTPASDVTEPLDR